MMMTTCHMSGQHEQMDTGPGLARFSTYKGPRNFLFLEIYVSDNFTPFNVNISVCLFLSILAIPASILLAVFLFRHFV